MKAYVIKRDDGLYYMGIYYGTNRFTTAIYKAMIIKYESDINEYIRICKDVHPKDFEHCKVVPVEIKECEDENN